MKTPTPQEQAEMLIEGHREFICGCDCSGKDCTCDPESGYCGNQETRNSAHAAIFTVETVISAKPIGNSMQYWQEVLTILKGKL